MNITIHSASDDVAGDVVRALLDYFKQRQQRDARRQRTAARARDRRQWHKVTP